MNANAPQYFEQPYFPYFIDTNILIYTLQNEDSAKRDISQNIIEHALKTKRGMISTQIMQEFINAVTRKFAKPFKKEHLSEFQNNVLIPLCKVQTTPLLIHEATKIHYQFKYSFYDSLVIVSAISGKCRTLLSEDMQHKQKIHELVIMNPFV